MGKVLNLFLWSKINITKMYKANDLEVQKEYGDCTSSWDGKASSAKGTSGLFKSLDEAMTEAKNFGNMFFKKSNMEFFNSVVYPRFLGGRFFLTSETPHQSNDRKFTWRAVFPGGEVKNLSEFHYYDSEKDAMDDYHDELAPALREVGYFHKSIEEQKQITAQVETWTSHRTGSLTDFLTKK